MRVFLRVLAGLALLLILGAVFLNFAEFRAPQLKPRIASALADIDPALQAEAGEVFIAVQLFRGRVRARLNDSTLRHPALGDRPLSVENIDLTLPLNGLIQGKPRASSVTVQGASLRINLPDAVAEALPAPGAQESASDYWGFVFRAEFLQDLTQILPDTLPQHTVVEDVRLEVMEPGGQRLFATLAIERAEQRLKTGDDGLILPDIQALGTLEPPQGTPTPLEMTAGLDGDGGARLSLRTGQVVPAQFYQLLRFAQLTTPERLTTPYRLSAAVQFLPDGASQTADMEITEILEDGSAQTFAVIRGTADPQTNEFDLHTDFAAVNARRLAPWTPVPEFLNDMDLVLGGTLDFNWNRLSNEWRGNFEVTQGSGTFAIPSIGLPSQAGGKVGARHVSAQGRFDRRGIVLNRVRVATGSRVQVGPILTAQISALTKDTGPEVIVRLASDQLRRGDAFYLWPTTVATKTREQVSNFVQAAAFEDFVFAGVYRLEPAQTPGQQAKFTRTHQEVRADFQFADVRITPDLPPFSNASGRLDLLDDGLDIRLDAADFGPAAMREGSTRIDFSNPRRLSIDVAGQVRGPLSQSLAALADGNIGLASLRALPLNQMSGQAQGQLGLSLAFDPATLKDQGIAREDINIDTRLSISDLRVRDYILGEGVRGGTLDLRITQDGLTGTGQMNLDGVQGGVTVRQTFDDAAALRVTASAQVPASRVSQFVPGLESFLDGRTQGQFTYVGGRGQNARLNVDLDLAQVAIDFPALVYRKRAGQAGRLQLDLVMGDQGPLRAENIRLTGPNLSAAGQLDLAPGSWRSMTLSRATVNRSDLRNIRLENSSSQFRARIGGGTLDLEPFLDQFTASTSSSSTSRSNQDEALGFGLAKPIILENSRISQLRFDAGAYLRDVDLGLIAADDGLRALSLQATVPPVESGKASGRVQAQITGDGRAGYNLWLNTRDFGSLLNALDMSPDVREGEITVTGSSLYPLGGGSWTLAADANNFRVLDTPALVKVLSAISLTGILEQLGGTGLTIADMEFRGTLAAPALHVSRLKVDGPSLGFSLAGALDWKRGDMNFRGALSILNLVNMVVRDIPLIGEILTGANKQGLLATQFQLSGAMATPNVRVEPLSIIQPGIFRSIIDEIEGQDY